jgi:hypothetical protein
MTKRHCWPHPNLWIFCWRLLCKIQSRIHLETNHSSWNCRKSDLSYCLNDKDLNRWSTNVVSSNPARGEMYSIEHHVIKFVSDLRQVNGFLQVLRFPPPIKLTAMI